MKDLFVNYNQASELKELGFDEPCFGRYDGKGNNKGKLWYEMPNSGQDTIPVGDVLAPTFSQAFRFFRDKHGLYSHIRESYSFDNTLEFVSQINGNYVNHGIFDKPVNRFYSYEEAESACLNKLIEIAKKIKENDDMISSDIVGY